MKTKKKDPILKREETLLNRLRLKAAKKNLDRKTDKYGSLSEAAEKGEKAVKKVIKADDRLNIVRPSTQPKSTPEPVKKEDPVDGGKKHKPANKPPRVKTPSSKASKTKAQYGKGVGTKGNKTGRGGKTFSSRRTGRSAGKY